MLSRAHLTLQILLCLALSAYCFGQSNDAVQPLGLKVNIPVEGNIAEGGMQTFALHLESNQFANLLLEQKNAKLEIAVDDAKSGERLIEANTNFGNFGSERVIFVNKNDAPRDLLIRVIRFSNDNGKGGFVFNLAEIKTADARDNLTFAAQAAMIEGLNSIYLPSKESRDKACAALENALKIARQTSDQTLETTILASLQYAYNTVGNYSKAQEAGNEAIKMLAGKETYELARMKFFLGFSLVSSDGIKQGLKILSDVLETARKLGDDDLTNITLNQLSYGYWRLADSAKSIEYAQQAYEMAKTVGNKEFQLDSLIQIGQNYTDLAEHNKSIEILNRALEIARDLKTVKLSKIYNELGRNASALGQPQKAIDYYRQALAVNLQYGGLKYNAAMYMANIARNYLYLGQQTRAIEYNQQAREIFKALGYEESEIQALSSTGNIYLSLKDYAKAKEQFTEALKRSEQISAGMLMKIQIINYLGMTEKLLNNYQAAIEWYLKAAQMRHGAKSRSGEAVSLGSAADAYFTLGQYDKAAELAESAVVISRAIGARNTESNALFTLARVRYKQNDLSSALQLIADSLKIIESIRSELISPESRTSFFDSIRNKYDFYILLLLEMQEQTENNKLGVQAFNVSEQSRARSLLDLLAESSTDISGGIDPELKKREQGNTAKMSALQTRLIRLKSADKPDQILIADLQKEIDKTDSEREQLESEIRRTNPRYAALKYPTILDLAQTQNLLDEKTVLLEYQTGAEASFLFAIGKNDFQIVRLPKELDLRKTVETLRRSISPPSRTGLANYLVAARELYQTLLAPIENLLKTKNRIIVVADGSLNYLPFEVLLRNKTDASFNKLPYLVRDFGISYVPSASVLANLRSAENASDHKSSKSFLAFAAPDYSAKNAVRNQLISQTSRSVLGENRSWDLTALPNAAIEAERIAKLFPADQATVFSGARATEEQVKTSDLLSRYRYLHFAVHGLINEQQPQFSSLVLSLPKPNDQSPEPTEQAAAKNSNAGELNENPTSNSAEDGLLQTPEIFNLKLRADLVTLSACETGLGKEMRGEGIVGLTRAFFYAGTPSVLVSLWKVDDASTAELMTDFYESLRKTDGREKAAALREAQLKMIAGNRYAHPYYWAPFVLQGTTGNRIEKKSPTAGK